MPYLLYVSDSKLDEIADEVPENILNRLAKELTIDVKVFQLKLTDAPSERTRSAKLRLAREYVKDEGLGTIDKPARYFAAELPMYWGAVGSDPQHEEVAAFGAVTQNTGVMLVGSAANIRTSKHQGLEISPSVDLGQIIRIGESLAANTLIGAESLGNPPTGADSPRSGVEYIFELLQRQANDNTV